MPSFDPTGRTTLVLAERADIEQIGHDLGRRCFADWNRFIALEELPAVAALREQRILDAAEAKLHVLVHHQARATRLRLATVAASFDQVEVATSSHDLFRRTREAAPYHVDAVPRGRQLLEFAHDEQCSFVVSRLCDADAEEWTTQVQPVVRELGRVDAEWDVKSFVEGVNYKPSSGFLPKTFDLGPKLTTGGRRLPICVRLASPNPELLGIAVITHACNPFESASSTQSERVAYVNYLTAKPRRQFVNLPGSLSSPTLYVVEAIRRCCLLLQRGLMSASTPAQDAPSPRLVLHAAGNAPSDSKLQAFYERCGLQVGKDLVERPLSIRVAQPFLGRRFESPPGSWNPIGSYLSRA